MRAAPLILCLALNLLPFSSCGPHTLEYVFGVSKEERLSVLEIGLFQITIVQNDSEEGKIWMLPPKLKGQKGFFWEVRFMYLT